MNAFAKIDKETFYRFVAGRRGERYEYVRGRIVQQMPGGTQAHGLVARRITRLFEDQLDMDRWHVLNERGVDTPRTIRYPEIVVEPVGEPLTSLSTLRPVLIVEVLSPSTTAEDLDVKPNEYLALPSLDAYIVASQDVAACLVWARGAKGEFPAEPVEIQGSDAVIKLRGRSLVVDLPLATVYRGIGDQPPESSSTKPTKGVKKKR